jgi:hypothetical protein
MQPRADRHEVLDDVGSRFGHLCDLLQRAAHRNRMLDNLFGIRLKVIAGRPVAVDTSPERAGACQLTTPSWWTAATSSGL